MLVLVARLVARKDRSPPGPSMQPLAKLQLKLYSLARFHGHGTARGIQWTRCDYRSYQRRPRWPPKTGHYKSPPESRPITDAPDINHGELRFAGMSNVLSEEKKQQVIALGKLGWPLRRIEKETGVRRDSGRVPEGGGNLCASSRMASTIAVKTGHAGGHRLGSVKTGQWSRGGHRLYQPFSVKTPIALPESSQSESVCEPFRETIELGLRRGRNAVAIWQAW